MSLIIKYEENKHSLKNKREKQSYKKKGEAAAASEQINFSFQLESQISNFREIRTSFWLYLLDSEGHLANVGAEISIEMVMVDYLGCLNDIELLSQKIDPLPPKAAGAIITRM